MNFTCKSKRMVLAAVLVLGLCSFGCNRFEDEMIDETHGLSDAAGFYRGTLDTEWETLQGHVLELQLPEVSTLKLISEHPLLPGYDYPVVSDCVPLEAGWLAPGGEWEVAIDLYATPMTLAFTHLEEGWTFKGDRLVDLVDP